MLENLRRKSTSKTYNDPIHQVHFEQGLARYESFIELGVCDQRLSKALQDCSFQKTVDIVHKETFSYFKLNMIYCPSGSFMAGNKNHTYSYERKTIQNPFLLSDAEISQELYQKVRGNNPSEQFQHPQNPVVNVSWFDAIAFCNELSDLQGLERCYVENKHNFADYGWDCDFKKNGYRLPTELEWEYAAKAGTENRYAGTDDVSQLGDYAWLRENSNDQIHPIRTKKPNGWGFYDMTGNVYEWCWDRKYDDDTFKRQQTGRVIRSSYFTMRQNSTSQDLSNTLVDVGNIPMISRTNLGFRIARTVTK